MNINISLFEISKDYFIFLNLYIYQNKLFFINFLLNIIKILIFRNISFIKYYVI